MDLGLLERLRRYEHAELGISEEFVTAEFRSGSALCIASRPLGEQQPVGWVISASPGPERGPLKRLEGLVARRLAAEGFPVLRVCAHVEGERMVGSRLSLPACLAETEDAIATLKTETGVEEVGVAGALLGGAVALTLFTRLQLELAAAWEPVTRGSRYLRDMLRLQRASALVDQGEETIGVAQNEFAEQGWTAIAGTVLTQEAYEELGAFDLLREPMPRRGSALVAAVSPTGEPSRRLAELSEHLGATLETVTDPLTVPFGTWYLRVGETPDQQIDSRLALDRALARTTVGWAVARVRSGSAA